MTLDLAAPWDSFPIAVVDFETTGPDPLTCEPVEVAVVRFEGGEPVRRWSSLLNHGVMIPAECTAVHGITDAMVAGAPRLDDPLVALSLFELCQGAAPCAYNAPFDRTILHRFVAGTECGAFDPAQAWIDPLVVVREVDRKVPGSGRHKLAATCARWMVQLDGAHRATADAEAAGRLLYRMLEKAKVKSCSLRSMLETTERKRAQQDADFQAWLAKQPPRAKEQT